MSRVTNIDARQILDTRGYPKAAELRDGGERWSAMGVSAAVEAVRGEVASMLRGSDANNQAAADRAWWSSTELPTSRGWGLTPRWPHLWR